MNNKLKLALIMILGLTASVSAISLGAGPSTLLFNDMLRGGYAEMEVTVSTAEDVNLNCTLEVTGDVKKWITIRPATTFVLPKQGRKTFLVSLSLPGDLGNQVYTGTLNIKAAPVTEVKTGTGFAVGAGVSLDIIVNVTGVEKSTYKIKKASVRDTETGFPVEFTLTVHNSGNIMTYPNLIINLINSSKVIEKTFTHNKTSIKPSRQKTFSISTTSEDLGIGVYTAHVNSLMLLKNDTSNILYEKVLNQYNLTFEIFLEGILSANGTFMTFLTDKKKIGIGKTIRITALFKNTGDIPITAALEGEILQDQEFIANFESKELEIPPGEAKNLIAYYTPEENGKFSVKGVVVYGKRITDSKQIALTVTNTDYTVYAGIAIVVLVVGGLLYKRRR